jgi:glyoxylase-like metal-dependent hydrolase (beta-lactamase superfamily II)
MRISWIPFNSAYYSVPSELMRAGAVGPPLRITTTWSVLEHPQGVVVIDTGAPVDDPAAEMAPGADVAARLRAIGLTTGNVRYVVNTHLHVDHVGGNRELADSTFLVDRDELAYACAPADPRLAAEYSLSLLAPDTLRYSPLPAGDHDLFGDGSVVVLTSPGHAAGHRSVLLRLPSSGTVLISGDAVWTRSNLAPDTLPGLLWSQAAYRRSRERLRRLAETEGARWFFSHEPSCFAEEGWLEGVEYD